MTMRKAEDMSSSKVEDEQPTAVSPVSEKEGAADATVSPDVIAVYVADAVKSVAGISRLQSTSWQALSGKGRSGHAGSGVAVRTDDSGRIDVDIHVRVCWDVAIPELAEDLRRAVTRRVEQLLGVTLAKVTLYVDGVEPPVQ